MPVKTMAERKALDEPVQYLPPTMELSQNDLGSIRFFLGMAYEYLPERDYTAYGQQLEDLYRRINRGRPITGLYQRQRS